MQPAEHFAYMGDQSRTAPRTASSIWIAVYSNALGVPYDRYCGVVGAGFLFAALPAARGSFQGIRGSPPSGGIGICRDGPKRASCSDAEAGSRQGKESV